MIKVNLLPPEYRKVEGTPVARLAITIAGVFLVSCAAGVWGYVHFGMLKQITDERDEKEQQLKSLTAQAERSQSLLREYKEYLRRRETIEKIGSSRYLWSKKLDELADLIQNKGDTKRHLVWLNTLRTNGGRATAPGSPISLSIHGWSGGDMSRKLSDFNSDLKNSEDFFADCMSVDPPEGQRISFSDLNVPNQAWEFNFNIYFKQPNWRETR